jgi:hypothetical protein
MSEIGNKIKKLKNFLVKNFNKINDDVCIRNRKINFIDEFYFSSLYNSNAYNTYNSVYNKLIIDDNYDNISKNAFIKKRNDIDNIFFNNINTNLINFIYQEINNKERFIAVDGSELTFLKSLDSHFKLNKHNTYTTGLVSCLYDVDLQIPINYQLSNSFNERNILINQLKYLKPNDVLIADRGYYSFEIIDKLFNSNINFVFRLKKSDIKVKEMNDNNLDSFIFNFNNDENKKVKIIKYSTYEYNNQEILKYNIDDLNKEYTDRKKYINDINFNITNLIKEIKQLKKENKTINSILINSVNNKLNELLLENKKIIMKRKKEINNEIDLFHKMLEESYELNKITINKIKLFNKINDSTYYIITNKLNYNIDKIKLIYKKRWGVEVHFRFSKDKFKFRNMDSKKLHIIEQNMLVTQFIFIIEGYIEFLLLKKIKDNKKINKSSVFDLMEKYIIKFLIISKSNKKNINKIIKILELIVKNVITQIIINYEKKRIKKRPSSKWNNVS